MIPALDCTELRAAKRAFEVIASPVNIAGEGEGEVLRVDTRTVRQAPHTLHLTLDFGPAFPDERVPFEIVK